MNIAVAQEGVVRLTEAAALQVQQLQEADPGHAGKPLRLYVENGGCSGLQYGLLFDEAREGDTTAECFGVTIVVDAFSATYLHGTVVDFEDALTGGGFKILNPNARQSCGCGNSFEAEVPPAADPAATA